MQFGTPHSALSIRARRGGTYIIVVGSALIVSTLGMMAILQQRVQRKGFEAAANMEQARLNAESAVRLGLLQAERDANWRNVAAAASGELLTFDSPEFGRLVLTAVDPHDGDLTDNANDAVVLRAASDVGNTAQYAERLLHPTPHAPDALFKGVVAGDDVMAAAATVRSQRPISSDAMTLASADMHADVEAVSMSGSTYHGSQSSVPDKDRPTLPDMTTLINEYTSRGTPINITSFPPNSPNLFLNPGIEQGQGNGNPANGWFSAPNPPESETCLVEQSTSTSHSGIASLYIKNRTGHSAGPVQFCTDWVKPNTTYQLEAWIYSNELLGGVADFRFSWYTDGTASSPQWQGIGSLLLDVIGDLGKWRRLSATITTGSWSGDLQSSYLKIESAGFFGPPNFYVDDVTVQEINARFLYRRVLSPNLNPFGATNPLGVYVIDCAGSPLIIERSRIFGTLVILNPGPGSKITGPMSWAPATPGYPSMIVGTDNVSYPANMRIATSRRGLSEARELINYNPAGTPHDAVGSDADQNDILPSEIRGWMYAGGTLTFDNAPTIHGVVMAADDVSFNGSPQIFWDPAPIYHAPPGLEGTLELNAREGASKKAVQ